MAISEKDIKKKMLVKKTINEMVKQIEKLEAQKEVYIKAAKEAKAKGLTAQYNLALSGLKMTMIHQRKVSEMKLNFEITSQMKDMTEMTSEFLKGMGSLSKDMVKLTKNKDFLNTQKAFSQAVESVQERTEQMELFMDETSNAFESQSSFSEEDSHELESLIETESNATGDVSDEVIDQEIEQLKKQMGL